MNKFSGSTVCCCAVLPGSDTPWALDSVVSFYQSVSLPLPLFARDREPPLSFSSRIQLSYLLSRNSTSGKRSSERAGEEPTATRHHTVSRFVRVWLSYTIWWLRARESRVASSRQRRSRSPYSSSSSTSDRRCR